MSIFNFWPFRRKPKSSPRPDSGPVLEPTPQPQPRPAPIGEAPELPSVPSPRVKPVPGLAIDVRRYFYNERGFQTYGSFFACWGGWASAGHVLTEASGKLPDFANRLDHGWPGGLDAALMDCTVPDISPDAPYPGQSVVCIGFPAGSAAPARREGKVYLDRSTTNGGGSSWIAHIITPDEPVVTGMSGGVVYDSDTHTPIGIIITRNSPADLNNDRDPDESLDFTALSDVWRAIRADDLIV